MVVYRRVIQYDWLLVIICVRNIATWILKCSCLVKSSSRDCRLEEYQPGFILGLCNWEGTILSKWSLFPGTPKKMSLGVSIPGWHCVQFYIEETTPACRNTAQIRILGDIWTSTLTVKIMFLNVFIQQTKATIETVPRKLWQCSNHFNTCIELSEREQDPIVILFLFNICGFSIVCPFVQFCGQASPSKRFCRRCPLGSQHTPTRWSKAWRFQRSPYDRIGTVSDTKCVLFLVSTKRSCNMSKQFVQ